MDQNRVTVAIAVPVHLAGLIKALGKEGFAPENGVPPNAIVAVAFLAKGEAEADRIIAIAKRWLTFFKDGAHLIEQPITPVTEEDLMPDTY